MTTVRGQGCLPGTDLGRSSTSRLRRSCAPMRTIPMPEPTPTVTASDRAIARKWYRTGRGIYIGDVTDMMAEIAAAREAWGVSREAVAGLVEAVERAEVYLTSGVTGG